MCLSLRLPGTSEVTGLFSCVAVMSPRTLKPHCFCTDGKREDQAMLGSACSWLGAAFAPHVPLSSGPSPCLPGDSSLLPTHSLVPIPKKGLVLGMATSRQVRFLTFYKDITQRLAPPREVCKEPQSHLWQGSHATANHQ